METNQTDYPESITLYRTKVALSITPSSKKIYISLAPFLRKDNNGNNTYDWKEKKVLIALSPLEVAAMILHFNNYYNQHYDSTAAISINPKSTGLYHKVGSKVAQFYFNRNKDAIKYPGYVMTIQNVQGKKTEKLTTNVSQQEGELLRIMFSTWLFYAYSWNKSFIKTDQ